jgi:hypothetical protein
MTPTETVTDFKLEEPDGKPVTFSAILKAVEKHCKPLLDGETFFDQAGWGKDTKDARLPKRWRSLIAWTMDGNSEGYYVHLGLMVDFGNNLQPGHYIDIGYAKLWDPNAAQAVATEAQRFLSAVRWN